MKRNLEGFILEDFINSSSNTFDLSSDSLGNPKTRGIATSKLSGEIERNDTPF